MFKNYSQNNIRALHRAIAEQLKTQNTFQEAWWLLEHVTGKTQSMLIVSSNFTLNETEKKDLKEALHQITVEAKPLQYILGSVPFCNLDILVEPPILIPRPETEEWSTWLIKKLHDSTFKKISILDLCCGTGCIGLALAKALPNSQVIGLDINPKAIDLAQKNKLHNAIENITFIKSDLYEALPKENQFDLTLSNPPYIREEEYEGLERSVTQWEDKKALTAENEGLEFYEKIIKKAHLYLKKEISISPRIVLEFGLNQSEQIKDLLLAYDFSNVKIARDYAGKPRWISGQKD
jgi:release factor glutamine methyltransferase